MKSGSWQGPSAVAASKAERLMGNFYMERSGSRSLNPLADPNTTEGTTRHKPPAVTQYKVQSITWTCLDKYWTWIWPSASTSSYNLLTIQGKGTYSTTAHWRHQENPESRDLQETSDLVFSTNKWQGGMGEGTTINQKAPKRVINKNATYGPCLDPDSNKQTNRENILTIRRGNGMLTG